MKRTTYLIIFLLCAWSLTPLAIAQATCSDQDNLWAEFCRNARDTWNTGRDDLYVPLHTHHLRSAWTSEEISRFNENPWGLGYGRSRYKQDRWEGLYGVIFLDSNYKPEPLIGYANQWLWGSPESLRAGLGYTLIVSAREDYKNYLPFPGILPIASLQYRRFSFNTSYVPGGRGFGNILFFWSRFEL